MKKPIFFAIIAVGLVHVYSTTMQKLNLTQKSTMGTTNLYIQEGDITQVNAQAIVNAANEQLAGGGGVCGAIFSAAGWDEMQTACDEYPEINGIRCPVGEARITPGFNLKEYGIEYVIHAVGPDCREVTDPKMQDELLTDAYKNSLILADKNNITSIAFPFISSAIFACPKERACEIGLKTIMDYVNSTPTTKIKEVRFVLFSRDDYELFVKTATQLGIKA